MADTLGLGIPGAAISATVGLTPVAQTTTDASGNFALPPLGAGVYALAASASGHARSARAVTLNAATATQNFQLASLPAAPGLAQAARQPPATFTQPPTGQMGSSLKVFDGAQFVPITAGNTPPPDRMTIVMTHGFNSNPEMWATNMAARLRAKGVNTSIANIVAWDWRIAAGGAIPEERTPSQGVALGLALQDRLGAGYSQKIHFIGHSLGTLVNAAAANFLHGDRTAQQTVSATPWSPTRTHLTLLDAAEASAGLELLGALGTLFDGISVSVRDSTDLIGGFDNVLLGWKPALPVRRKWADNYVSLVGLYEPDSVNVYLDKAQLIFRPGPIEQLAARHAYSHQWYAMTVTNPSGSTLGFQRSHEARQAGLSAFDFIVEGNPVDDVLVCGIGETNLFSLESKYVPTNTIPASRLIDVSAWAGTTNELFFGFMGGTSTNATLHIENIRFYSVTTPRLEIARSGNATLLSWPSTAGGFVVETTPALTSPTWESVSNAPAISADRYILTNSWSDQARFFRLRAR